jgi:CHAD domain-containing protein
MAKSKNISGLHCLGPADKMVPLVLRAQLKSMCALRKKALDWKDPDGVHDMRVLSRRLRSAVSDFKPYLLKSTLPRRKLVAIGKKLGAVRDEDVTLAALEELKAQASGSAADGIELLAEQHKHRRKNARTALKSAIKPSTVTEFRKEFLSKLRELKVVPSRELGAKGSEDLAFTFSCIGIDIVKERLKEFCVASPDLYLSLENKKLHELRILAKRLRYAIEIFETCWGDEMNERTKEISLLQTSLGEMHDCDVWIENLGAKLKQVSGKKKNEDNVRLIEGAGWLLHHFARERTGHYQDALRRWERWEADGFLERLKSSLEESSLRPEAITKSSRLVKSNLTNP